MTEQEQDPQDRITELERDLAESEGDTRTMQIVAELRLGTEHVDALRAAGDQASKIELGERLAAGQPQAAIAAAPAASRAPSHARAPRDGRGRFSPAPGGFGGGTAPSGQRFTGHPAGEHPADNALRTAAGF